MDETQESPAGTDAVQHAPPLREVCPASQAPDGPGTVSTFTLQVDGEQFAVREAVDLVLGYTDTGYTWLSGPNEGYGFAAQGPGRPSVEDHRRRLRDFLSWVDPDTGFMKED